MAKFLQTTQLKDCTANPEIAYIVWDSIYICNTCKGCGRKSSAARQGTSVALGIARNNTQIKTSSRSLVAHSIGQIKAGTYVSSLSCSVFSAAHLQKGHVTIEI